MRSAFISVLFFISFFVVAPEKVASQSLSKADTIRFTIPEGMQFAPGRASIPEALKNRLAEVKIEQREDFSKLWVIGTYDEMKWRKKSCNVEGSIPLQEDWSLRQDQCDALIAGFRAFAVAQYINDKNWVDNSLKVQARRLFDESDRSVLLIFANNMIEAKVVEDQIEQIEKSIRKLWRKTQQNEKRIATNRNRIQANDDQLADHEHRLDKLEKEVRDGPKLSAFLGIGGQQFARVTTPGVAGGLRLGNLELAGWYGYRPPFATVKLPEPDGMMKYGRSSYGGSLTWYPNFLSFHDDKLELGPTVGGMHGEDYLDGREEFITVYEAVQVGLSADFDLVGPLSFAGRLLYSPVRRADVPDLKLDRSGPQWGGRLTLRLNL